MTHPEGWHGWDEYAKYYDWENARTSGRRDVRFWQGYCTRHGGRVLELAPAPGASSSPSRGPASRSSASIGPRTCRRTRDAGCAV